MWSSLLFEQQFLWPFHFSKMGRHVVCYLCLRYHSIHIKQTLRFLLIASHKFQITHSLFLGAIEYLCIVRVLKLLKLFIIMSKDSRSEIYHSRSARDGSCLWRKNRKLDGELRDISSDSSNDRNLWLINSSADESDSIRSQVNFADVVHPQRITERVVSVRKYWIHMIKGLLLTLFLCNIFELNCLLSHNVPELDTQF